MLAAIRLIGYLGTMGGGGAFFASRFTGLVASDTGSAAALVGGAAFALLVYVFPSSLAADRNHPKRGAILALNLLLGWTFLGWVVSLVWALAHQKS